MLNSSRSLNSLETSRSLLWFAGGLPWSCATGVDVLGMGCVLLSCCEMFMWLQTQSANRRTRYILSLFVFSLKTSKVFCRRGQGAELLFCLNANDEKDQVFSKGSTDTLFIFLSCGCKTRSKTASLITWRHHRPRWKHRYFFLWMNLGPEYRGVEFIA